MGILAGIKQSTGSTLPQQSPYLTGSTSGNRIYFEWNTGFYYVVGTTDRVISSNGTDAFVAKYDQSGVLQWQRTIGGTGTETGKGVYADSSGNVYITGTTTSSGAGGSDVLIVKYNSSGDLVWQRTWGGSGTDIGNAIYVDTTYVLITGSTTSAGYGGIDAFILYLNTSGGIQFQKCYYSSQEDVGTGITYDVNYGRFVICGNTRAPNTAIYTPFVISVDTAGNVQWGQTYYSGSNDIASKIIYNPQDAHLYFTGNFGGTVYAQISKIYGNNSFAWTRMLYGGSNMIANGLSWDRANNLYLCGTTSSASGNNFIAKYDNSGTIQWQKSLIANFSLNDIWVDFNQSGLSNRDFFYATGSKTSATFSDANTIKLPQNGTNTGTYSNYTYSDSSFSNRTDLILSGYNQGNYMNMATPTLSFSTPTTITSSPSGLTSSSATSGSYYTTTLGGNADTGITSSTTNKTGQYTTHSFTGSSSFTFIPSSTGFVDILSIGAGGDCGAPGPGSSGGGGAGAVVYKKFVKLTSGTSYPIKVGISTINGSGGNTVFNSPGVGVASVTAFGGGAGGPGAGGFGVSSPNSSGGGGSSSAYDGGSGYGAVGFGYPGAPGSPTHAGGGGGAGSVGEYSSGSTPGLGGSGVPIAYFTGISTNIVSAGGGPGVTPPYYGNGGQSSTPGTSQGGVLYIRYI